MSNDTILQTAINLSPSVVRKKDALIANVASDLVLNPQNATKIGAKDEVLTMKVPAAMSAGDVVPGNPTLGDAKFYSKNLTLAYHRDAPFKIQSAEFNAQILAGVVPGVMAEAIKAVIADVESKIHTLCWYKAPTYRTGDGTIDDLIAARNTLNKAGVPDDGRSFVFSSGLDAKYQGVFNGPGVYQADPQGLAAGKFAPRMGFNMAYSAACDASVFTAGTLVTGDNPIVKAAETPAVGDTTITVTNDTNGRTVAKGDQLTIAGDTQPYVVTANLTLTTGATGYAISISPPLRVAVVATAAITVARPTGACASLAFHKMGILLASRIPAGLQDSELPWSTYTDPVTGLVLVLQKISSYHQNIYAVSCLYGVEIGADPNLVTRVHYTS